jgi:hypothetical protein
MVQKTKNLNHIEDKENNGKKSKGTQKKSSKEKREN